VAATLAALAEAVAALGRPAEAAELQGRAVAVRRDLYGRHSPQAALSLAALAEIRRQQGRPKKALGLFRDCLDSQAPLFGPDSLQVAATLCRMVPTLHDLGQNDEAASALAQARKAQKKTFGKHSAQVAAVDAYLAELQNAKPGELLPANPILLTIVEFSEILELDDFFFNIEWDGSGVFEILYL
jgi:hypothetical protein